eukprot:tig00000489_g1367.t1
MPAPSFHELSGRLEVEMQRLLDAGLFGSAEILGSFLLSGANTLKNSGSPQSDQNAQQSDWLLMYADALYGKEEYRRALLYYRNALKTRKLSRNPTKGIKPGIGASAQPQQDRTATFESEVKFKMCNCYLKLRDTREALAVLESIPQRSRTIAVNMLLAKLYAQTSVDPRLATACYREVLKQDAHAVEALLGLTELGVDCTDAAPDWFLPFLRAHLQFSRNEYRSALASCEAVEGAYPGNAHALVLMSKCQAMMGRLDDSIYCFQKVHAADDCRLDDTDLYGGLLHSGGHAAELNKLARETMRVEARRAEPWVVAALYCDLKQDGEKALQYAERASGLEEGRNAQAHMLRGRLLLKCQRHEEAIAAYRKAYALRKDMISAKGLVEAYMALGKVKEALTVARNSLAPNKNAPVALALVGSVLSRTPDGRERARGMLERALQLDPDNLDTVGALADFYLAEGHAPAALHLLRGVAERHTRDVVHVKLADVLAQAREYGEAIRHYHAALALNALHAGARRGLERVEKLSRGVDPDEAEEAAAEEDADDSEGA